MEYTNDYLLDKQVKILQPVSGYRTSTDAVLLSSLPDKLKAGDKILDVGSGTGGISLCLAHRFPDISITGLEIQEELSTLSNLSATANSFDNLVYYNCDIKDKKLPVKPCSFTHVISNPPYSEHDMPSPNKSKALAHNHDNFSLSQWIGFCLKMLKPFGRLYFIHRSEAIDEFMTALRSKAGGITIIPIYSKPNQSAKRIMIMAQKDSKAPSVILPPFYTHNPDGSYTVEAERLLRKGQSFFKADI